MPTHTCNQSQTVCGCPSDHAGQIGWHFEAAGLRDFEDNPSRSRSEWGHYLLSLSDDYVSQCFNFVAHKTRLFLQDPDGRGVTFTTTTAMDPQMPFLPRWIMSLGSQGRAYFTITHGIENQVASTKALKFCHAYSKTEKTLLLMGRQRAQRILNRNCICSKFSAVGGVRALPL